MTETGSGVVYDGHPLPGVEVRIEGGEILVRGPMVATAYRDGTPVVDAEGWLHTGDLGDLDDGVLTVHGRRGDMIISGGENVHPDPVERRLRQHPAIADAAVVGRPDPEWGQRVVAVVEVVPGPPAPSLERSEEQTSELQHLMRISYDVSRFTEKHNKTADVVIANTP